MRLTLTVLRCPDSVTPETRTITGGELTVGRGPGMDYWVLSDPKNLISRRHFTVVFRGGEWRIIDESANGTFLNREDGPIGKGNERRLQDHDRLRVGPYEIEVHFDEEDGPRQAYGRGYDAAASIDPFEDPFSDPLRPTDGGPGPVYGAPFAHRTQEDHSSVLNDAIRPAQPVGHMPLHTGGLIPSDDLLSEDWEKELLEGMYGASSKPVTGAPGAFFVPPSAPVTTPAVASGIGDGQLLSAFLLGVGLPDATPSDPAATLQKLGEAFRALVVGLRSALIARASVKSEFRIEQTMIRVRGNNPLKFAANDDDAVSALLGVGRRIDMAPAAAVTDALRDMRLHELASVAAMQSAIRTLMDGLDPEKIRLEAEQGGLLPGQRKARAWDAYVAHHTRMSQALSDDFDSVFGKAFARAYEEALEELLAMERQ